jgi:hypothetical protein
MDRFGGWMDKRLLDGGMDCSLYCHKKNNSIIIIKIIIIIIIIIILGSIQGSMRLRDHFIRIANQGGELEEIDKMTTTTGILDAFTKNEYAK